MIKFEKEHTVGWEQAVRGMRNPMNSWAKSDSRYVNESFCGNDHYSYYEVGRNDLKLMEQLREAGTDHRKYMRMIVVYVDITAPMYWWSEYDTYKVGTVANSCSKMHKLLHKPFEMNDFSFEKLQSKEFAQKIVNTLNELRDKCINCDCDEEKKRIWYSILQILPESYNQKRTVMLNYEVLANMYKSRKYHKLDEWQAFCDWAEQLSHSELITG